MADPITMAYLGNAFGSNYSTPGQMDWLSQLMGNPYAMNMLGGMGQGMMQHGQGEMIPPQRAPALPPLPMGRSTPIQFLPPPQSTLQQRRPPWWLSGSGSGF